MINVCRLLLLKNVNAGLLLINEWYLSSSSVTASAQLPTHDNVISDDWGA